ncbi:MAG: choice-of-anchor D domain-containing protein [Bacteroidota bacterium]
MKHHSTVFLKVFFMLLCGLVLSQQVSFAQDFIVSRIDTSKFPVITADFTATDAAGKPRTGLQSSDFTVTENGTPIAANLVKLSCGDVQQNPDVSVLLVMDVSLSMDPSPQNGNQDRMDWMRFGANTFIDNLNFSTGTTVALSSFSTYSYLNVNFTNSKPDLKKGIDTLKALAATYYNNPFLHQVTGAINVFKSRPENIRKILIFMTDGDPTDADKLETQKIIDSLKHYNIQAFSIALGSSVNNAFLPTIARETGGKYFVAKTKEELVGIYKLLAIESQTQQICYLEWTTRYSCNDLDRIRNAKITFKPLGKTENKFYTAPVNSIAKLQPSESILSFGNTALNVDTPLQVIFTAQNTDFYITDLPVSPPGYFQVASGGVTRLDGSPFPLPGLLQKGQSIKVTVVFTQKGQINTFRQAELTVNSTPCAQSVTLVGGLSQVRLISPNGKDPQNPSSLAPFKTCDTIDIQWSGVEKTDPVNLYYSTSNGSPNWNWIPIASAVKGLSYKWKAPQAGVTYRIKVEVAQKKLWQWSEQFGSKLNDFSQAIDVTPDSYFSYIAGHFEDTVNFAGSAVLPLHSKGQQDIFVAKYDTDGNVKWATKAGGYQNDSALALVSDPSNNVYIAGAYTKLATFGTQDITSENLDGENFFIAKYTSKDGNFPEWVISGRGQSATLKGVSRATKIAFGTELGVKYVYVNIDCQYYTKVQGVNTVINLSNSATQIRKILRIPVDNYKAATLYSGPLPAGVSFAADPKHDIDGNQNDYYTGSFNPTLRGSFNPSYNRPGIPDLTTTGGSDAFIAKYGGIPGSSDSSKNVFEVVSPVIAYTIQIEPNVGSIAVGQEKPVQMTAQIKNTGTVDLFLQDIQFVGTNPSDFKIVTSVKDKLLKVGETIDLEILFKPTDLGTRTADLVVVGSCGASSSIAVSGNGLPPCNAVKENYDFKTVGLNITSVKSDLPCLLKYTGQGPVTFKPVVRGGDEANFTIGKFSPADANGFVTLNSGDCFTAEITFKPTIAQKYVSYIVYEGLEECGAPRSELFGEGLRPNLSINPQPWGLRRISTKSPGRITLKNNDTIDAIINDIKLADPSSTIFGYQFVTLFTPGQVLKAKDSIVMDVTFAPTIPGTLSNSINVYVEGFNINEPLRGELSGTGFLPILEARDTIFTPVLVGTAAEQIDEYIHNRAASDTSMFIEKIEVIQNEGDDFSFAANGLDVNSTKFTITGKDSSAPLKINFTPSKAGLRFLKLAITSDAAPGSETETNPRVIDTVVIIGEGLDITQTSLVPFTNTLTCETPTQTVTFKNESTTQTLDITSFTLQSGNAADFTITPPSLSIAPGTSKDVTVTFKPTAVATYNADFKVDNSFKKEMHIVLEGNARIAELALALDPIASAAPGTIITVPVKLTSGDYGTFDVTSLSFLVKFDPLLLDLKKVNNAMGWTFTPTVISKGVIEIKGTGPALQKNLLKTDLLSLEFEVYLSKPNSTPVEISEIKTGSDCIVPKNVNSSFALGDVCFLDARPVKLSTTQYQLQEITPNPVSDQAKLVYGVGLDGRTVINLYNSEGVLVMPVIDEVLLTGSYETIIPLHDIPAGVYFYTMYSGPYSATRKLVITK